VAGCVSELFITGLFHTAEHPLCGPVMKGKAELSREAGVKADESLPHRRHNWGLENPVKGERNGAQVLGGGTTASRGMVISKTG